MATLREFFDTDLNRCLSSHADWQMNTDVDTALPTLRARISLDLEANAKCWSFFIPCGVNIAEYVGAIFNTPETSRCVLSGDTDSVYVQSGWAGYSELASSESLVFTQRIFLYIDDDVSERTRNEIVVRGRGFGFHVLVRDREYATRRSELEKPLAFIAHDTRDKDGLVRELAFEISKLMCPVWYDEYSLKVGDSLRVSIEKGLKETHKCVVILSPHFFSNEGWGRAEFDSIFTREIIAKHNVMLPVWHNVGVKEVYDYCPRLVDKVGLNSALGSTELARKLVHAIKQAST